MSEITFFAYIFFFYGLAFFSMGFAVLIEGDRSMDERLRPHMAVGEPQWFAAQRQWDDAGGVAAHRMRALRRPVPARHGIQPGAGGFRAVGAEEAGLAARVAVRTAQRFDHGPVHRLSLSWRLQSPR